MKRVLGRLRIDLQFAVSILQPFFQAFSFAGVLFLLLGFSFLVWWQVLLFLVFWFLVMIFFVVFGEWYLRQNNMLSYEFGARVEANEYFRVKLVPVLQKILLLQGKLFTGEISLKEYTDIVKSGRLD